MIYNITYTLNGCQAKNHETVYFCDFMHQSFEDGRVEEEWKRRRVERYVRLLAPFLSESRITRKTRKTRKGVLGFLGIHRTLIQFFDELRTFIYD